MSLHRQFYINPSGSRLLNKSVIETVIVRFIVAYVISFYNLWYTNVFKVNFYLQFYYQYKKRGGGVKNATVTKHCELAVEKDYVPCPLVINS